MTVGLVDIGSNTIRMCIYHAQTERLLIAKKTVAGLAGHVEQRALTKKGIGILLDVLGQYKQIFSDLSVEHVVYFSTASLRNIENQKDVLKQVKKKLAIEIDVIDGKTEALYGLIGSKKSLHIDDAIYVDIGGGSTEIIYLKQGQVMEAVSLPMGSLNLSKKYVKGLIPTIKEAKDIKKAVKEALKGIETFNDVQVSDMIGVGGTVRAIRRVHLEQHDGKVKKPNQLNIGTLKSLEQFMKQEETKTLYELADIVPERLHTFLPGLLILSEIAKKFSSETIHVSDTGVREGYLVERLLPKLKHEDI